eukprot:3497366-Pyramimonas_sp.AAC.1
MACCSGFFSASWARPKGRGGGGPSPIAPKRPRCRPQRPREGLRFGIASSETYEPHRARIEARRPHEPKSGSFPMSPIGP